MFKSTLLGGFTLIFLCSSFLIGNHGSDDSNIDVKFENIRCNDLNLTALKLKKVNNTLGNELKVQFIVNSENQVQQTKVRTITFSEQGLAEGDCEHPELLIDQSALFSNEGQPKILNVKVRIL